MMSRGMLLGVVVLARSILPSACHRAAAAFSPPMQACGLQRKIPTSSSPPNRGLYGLGRLHGEAHVRSLAAPEAYRAIQKSLVLAASPSGSDEDSDERDYPIQPRYSDPEEGMMQCFIRYTVDGGKMGRDGRLVRFLLRTGGGQVSGAGLLELLEAEGIDLTSLRPFAYDQRVGGWVQIAADMSFDYDESHSKRVDVKLVPAWDPAFTRKQCLEQQGYFSIGVLGLRHAQNLGTLWRSAFQMGASSVFIIGGKYDKTSTDVTRAWTNIPLVEHADWIDFAKNTPYAAQLVAVEMGGEPLETFEHPQRAVYVLGSENTGIPQAIVRMCHAHVTLPSVRYESFNVAVAGSIIMYDRLVKSGVPKDTAEGLRAHEALHTP